MADTIGIPKTTFQIIRKKHHKIKRFIGCTKWWCYTVKFYTGMSHSCITLTLMFTVIVETVIPFKRIFVQGAITCFFFQFYVNENFNNSSFYVIKNFIASAREEKILFLIFLISFSETILNSTSTRILQDAIFHVDILNSMSTRIFNTLLRASITCSFIIIFFKRNS